MNGCELSRFECAELADIDVRRDLGSLVNERHRAAVSADRDSRVVAGASRHNASSSAINRYSIEPAHRFVGFAYIHRFAVRNPGAQTDIPVRSFGESARFPSLRGDDI